MKIFVQKPPVVERSITLIVFLIIFYFVATNVIKNFGIVTQLVVMLTMFMIFFLYDKHWIVYSTSNFIITDSKISYVTNSQEFMYGIRWADIACKSVHKIKGKIKGFRFYPKDKLEFSDDPFFEFTEITKIKNLWIPVNVYDSEKFIKLVQEYSKLIPERKVEDYGEFQQCNRSPQFKAILFKIIFISLLAIAINSLNRFVNIENNDKRTLSTSERKMIYEKSGEKSGTQYIIP